jgi:hypothetical protein
MKKQLLILYIALANLSFVGGIKANHTYSPPCHVKKAFVEESPIQVKNNEPVQFSLVKNNLTVSPADSLRGTNADLLFSNDKISISSVYPNPASAIASIDYVLGGNTTHAKIILCNVLGNVVGEYTLVKDARRLNISTLELTSGVYFYALYVDGKNLVTRKLIIKHNS